MNTKISRLHIGIFLIIPLYVLFYHAIDTLAFDFLNGHLVLMPTWYCTIFAIFNHQFENMVNILFVIISLIYVRLRYRNAPQALSLVQFILAIAWYECIYMIIQAIESLEWVRRHSPSMEYALFYDLRSLLKNVKVYAYSSFPSGHALLFGYFSGMVRTFFPQKTQTFFICCSRLWCLPRVVGGAHWLSDVITGYTIGYFSWQIFYRALKLPSIFVKILSRFHHFSYETNT